LSNIAMAGGATGSGTVTLLAPSTSTNRTINLPDSNGTILTTATAGVPVNGPAFSAYSASTQTPTSGIYTKVIFGTEVFDTNSNFASSRLTPTVAGYYQLNASVSVAADTNISSAAVVFYKNGAGSLSLPTQENTSLSGTGYQTLAASCLVYLNGSTDYMEVYALVTGTGTNRYIFLSQDIHQTAFSGCMVRSAV
jgi:hypothetical protein